MRVEACTGGQGAWHSCSSSSSVAEHTQGRATEYTLEAALSARGIMC